MNTHPDYMNLNGRACGREEYPAGFYEQILRHIQDAYQGQYWHVLPRDLARFWMRSVRDDEHDAHARRSLQAERADVRREAEKTEETYSAGEHVHE
jgi:hypothetical protein